MLSSSGRTTPFEANLSLLSIASPFAFSLYVLQQPTVKDYSAHLASLWPIFEHASAWTPWWTLLSFVHISVMNTTGEISRPAWSDTLVIASSYPRSMKLRCVRPHSTRVCVLTGYASCIPTNHLIPDASGQAAASAARTGAFDNISRLYEADREDEDTPISFPSTIKITLCELFDFSSAFWASYQRRTSVSSLE